MNYDDDDVTKVYEYWKFLDHDAFRKSRLRKIKVFADDPDEDFEDFRLLKTSGSSSCKPKKYKWGPNFALHYDLYNKIFYSGQNFVNLFLLPHSKNSFKASDHVLSIGVLNAIPENRGSVQKNIHVVSNPEVLYIYMKRYGDFLDRFFDKKSCIFSFTGSALKDEFKSFFTSLGMKCKDHMRCWDGGATYYTCDYFNKHWVEFSSVIRFENNKLISTDLWNIAQPFVDYWNKDRLTSTKLGKCECGLEIVDIKWIENPRYFVVKGKEYCYDAVVEVSKKYGDFDFVSVEFCDKGVVVNVCHTKDADIGGLEKDLSERYEVRTIVKKTELPEYSRKYRRVKKIHGLYI